uniref:Chlorophyll a-b binding protein, chloroplastic n=1 Tax=Lotharella oceanica TaxID=641309 RepID=A0A7S2TU13_9EUKA
MAGIRRPSAAAVQQRTPISRRLNNIVAKSSESAAPGQAPEPAVEPEPIKKAYTYPAGSAPLGPYFDPLGFSKGKSESEMKRIREAEITHSRVAMLAVLGFLFQEALLDRPLFWKQELGPIEGPAIYHFQEVSERYPLFWLATIPFFAFHENLRARIGWQDPTKGGDLFGINETYEPGNLGFDPFQAYPLDSAGQREMQQKELNNGRLAMLAVAGFMAQELVNGKTIYENLGLDKLVPPHGPV